MPAALVTASAAHLRIARAREWLAGRAPGEQVLVVAANPDAAHELLREAAAERGAAFGWHRTSFGGLAAQLARTRLLAESLVPVGRLVSQAVAARALHRLRPAGGLGRNHQKEVDIGRLPGTRIPWFDLCLSWPD